MVVNFLYGDHTNPSQFTACYLLRIDISLVLSVKDGHGEIYHTPVISCLICGKKITQDPISRRRNTFDYNRECD